MAPIVRCVGLTKNYGRKTALNQIYLNLDRGKIIGLLGPNGSGKTTLIKIMNGLLEPSSGEILINGQRPGVETKSKISYLPERTYLQPGMKVLEVVEYFHDFYPDFQVDRAYDMLARLQIQPYERLKNLSKGTKEKVQLILVMSRDADLYVLDEPIAGVDPASRDYILHTIVGNYNRNATILLSTHLISDVENILDEVVFIRQGNIILQAGAEEIRRNEGKSVDRFFREVFVC
ncbi:MAG: ABC transporter ATP-binding protein [Lachnospiraceae bacterium]|nr:ABC transporter ATP-binding protein [Lachnospiraceae bacterium]